MGTLRFAHPTRDYEGYGMSDYRRAFVAGGCYFFTLVTQGYLDIHHNRHLTSTK